MPSRRSKLSATGWPSGRVCRRVASALMLITWPDGEREVEGFERAEELADELAG